MPVEREANKPKFSDAHIRNAKKAEKPYKLLDGGGLYVEIRPTGSKLWRYRYKIGGKENLFALGEYAQNIPKGETEEQASARRRAGLFTLLEARIERERCRRLVKQGVHPARERKLENIRQANEANTTFEAVLREWVDARHWAASTKANRLSQIEMHLIPALGALSVKEIKPAHVLDVLRRVEKKVSDTRKRKRGADTRQIGGGTVVTRLRQVISGTFDHAIATLRVETNPAAPVGKSFKAHRTNHKTPLKEAEIGALLRATDDYSGHFQTAAALSLLWLTLVRPSELAGAQWKEIDLDAATWTIPAERMKMAEQHVVPLPAQAVELFKRLQALNGQRTHVFPHRDRRAEAMTYDAMNKGISRLSLPFHFTPHAVRTTASTILNTMGFRGEVIESQLAHQERNAVRRAYNRATYLEERRAMMQQWADMLDAIKSGVGKVVTGPFGQAA